MPNPAVATDQRLDFRSPTSGLRLTTRIALLATAVNLALIAGGASAAPEVEVSTAKINPVFHKAKGATTLYYQNSGNNGYGFVSQNFTSGDPTYNSSGADDFVIPKGQIWTVTRVDVTGAYVDNSGTPATSENVIFYKDSNTMPGKAVKGGTFNDLSCADQSGSFMCSLGKGIKLKAGHYWVAVVANCEYFDGCGYWVWAENGNIYNDPAMWENPGGGFNICDTWDVLYACNNGHNSADFMFDLQGKARK